MPLSSEVHTDGLIGEEEKPKKRGTPIRKYNMNHDPATGRFSSSYISGTRGGDMRNAYTVSGEAQMKNGTPIALTFKEWQGSADSWGIEVRATQDGTRVGELDARKVNDVMSRDGLYPTDKFHISWVNTDPAYTHQGIATAMLEFSRQNASFPVVHSPVLSSDGAAWAEVVKYNHNHDSETGQFTTGDSKAFTSNKNREVAARISARRKSGDSKRATYTTADGQKLTLQYDEIGGRPTVGVFDPKDKEWSLGEFDTYRVGTDNFWRIKYISVDQLMRRQGVATAMLEFARENSALPIEHSNLLTDDGAAFSQVVKSVPIRKYNPNHEPAGSSKGGQFASGGDFHGAVTALSERKFGSKGLTVKGEWEELGFKSRYHGWVLAPDGSKVGTFDRGFYTMEGYVEHSDLHLDEAYQRTGFASEFNAALEHIYAQSGFEKVRTMAVGDGAYVWAKAGFRMDDSRDSAFDARAAIANAMRNKAGGDAFSIDNPNPKVTTPADKQRILDMADAFEHGSYSVGPTMLDIANLSVEGFPDMGERILTSGVYFPGVREVEGVAKSAERWPDYSDGESVTEVKKYNMNHDELGRFTSGITFGTSSASFTDKSGKTHELWTRISAPDPEGEGDLSEEANDITEAYQVIEVRSGEAYSENVLQAVQWAAGEPYTISWLYVDEADRRKGVASALLETARHFADAPVEHSESLTSDGEAFSTVVKYNHNHDPEDGRFTSGPDTGYRGMHTAPYNDGETPSLAFAANGETSYPKDLLSANGQRYYGMGDPAYKHDEQAAIEHIRQAMATGGTSKVTVYRALPADVKDAKINPGDWVTPSLKYATDHGEGNLGWSDKVHGPVPYQIIETTVPSAHLYTDGNSLLEWGYDPSTEVQKYNPYHKPAGGPDGGEFTSADGWSAWTVNPVGDGYGNHTPEQAENLNRQTSLARRAMSKLGVPEHSVAMVNGWNSNNTPSASASGTVQAWFSVKNPDTLNMSFDAKLGASYLIHEYGHMMDWNEGSGIFASSDPKSRFYGVTKVIMQTSSYKGWLYGPNANYWASNTEVFARAFAQWVGIRSGESELAEQTVKVSNLWPEDDFAPIAAEFDKLFDSTIKKYNRNHKPAGEGTGYQIIEATVPASELYTDANSLLEWGWDPSTEVQKSVPIRKYDPDQPRAPRGTPTGGQWTSGQLISSGIFELETSDSEAEEYVSAKAVAKVMASGDVDPEVLGAYYDKVSGSDGGYEPTVEELRPFAQKYLDQYGGAGLALAYGGMNIEPYDGNIVMDNYVTFTSMEEFETAFATATLKENAFSIINSWGYESNSGTSAILQSAVAALWPNRKTSTAADILAAHGNKSGQLFPETRASEPLFESFAKAQYSLTQNILGQRGVTEVTLYRGIRSDNLLPTGDVPILSRPLSSWTADRSVAMSFATTSVGNGINPGANGYLLEAKFSAADLFSIGGSGVGFGADMAEVVVLGDQIDGTVTSVMGGIAKSRDGVLVLSFEDEDWLRGGVTKRFNPAQLRDPKGVPTGGRWTAGGVAQLNGWSAEGEATQKARLDKLFAKPVIKYNENHDELGRFTFRDGAYVMSGWAVNHLDPATTKRFEAVLTEIEKVHKLPVEKELELYAHRIKGIAAYQFSDDSSGEAQPVSRLWFSDVAKNGDIAHEYGHFLDRQYGLNTGNYAILEKRNDLLGAIKASEPYRNLLQYDQRQGYTTDHFELVARAYAQYIEMNGGDLGGYTIQSLSDPARKNWQWKLGEFQPINDAMKDYLTAMGIESAVTTVVKYNPYHDPQDGKFTSGVAIGEEDANSAIWSKTGKDSQAKMMKQVAADLAKNPKLGKYMKDVLVERGDPGLITEEYATQFGVEELSKAWAQSSSSTMSMFMHNAAAKVLGASSALENDELSPLAVREFNAMSEATKLNRSLFAEAMVKSVYDKTQAVLKARGIKSVQLFRGLDMYGQSDKLLIGYKNPQVDEYGNVSGQKVIELEDRPLSSWSSSLAVAKSFASDVGGWVLSEVVDAKDIWSIADVTGPGSSPEQEFIVLSRPGAESNIDRVEDI